jgi:hypothetical protein
LESAVRTEVADGFGQLERIIVSIKSLTILVGAVVTGLLIQAGLPAEEPAATPEAESSLAAPEFVDSFDPLAASAALREDDGDALLEQAERLAAAEAEKGKVNGPLPASALYRGALAAFHRAGQSDKLKETRGKIDGAKLSQEDRTQLIATLDQLEATGSAARKVDVGPGLKPKDVTPESVALYQSLKKELAAIREYGTDDDLRDAASTIKQLRELHPRQRQHLIEMASVAQVAIRERGQGDTMLAQLAGASRGGTQSGIRMYGPAVVREGEEILIVLAVTQTPPRDPRSAAALGKAVVVQLKPSAGITCPSDVSLGAVPLVVKVKVGKGVSLKPLKTVAITATAAKANGMWAATVPSSVRGPIR